MAGGSASKEKILETAARLFFRYGYRAVGVDTIAAEAGIGKMTLYRHFASKDELIVAYLRESDAHFWRSFDELTKPASSPREQLLAFFAGLQGYVTSPGCYGCPFLNVATEYPEPEYAGHQIATAHKQEVRTRFWRLARDAGAHLPEFLADGLCILMDGAYMSSRLYGASSLNPATRLTETARSLVDAHCAGKT